MPTRMHQSDAAPDADSRPGTRDASLERLARQFGEVVENVPQSEREELREYAVELLREESEAARQKETERTAGARQSPLGVFGFVLLLIMAGGALLFVLPPIGIVLLFLALPLAGWGILQTVFGKAHAPGRPPAAGAVTGPHRRKPAAAAETSTAPSDITSTSTGRLHGSGR